MRQYSKSLTKRTSRRDDPAAPDKRQILRAWLVWLACLLMPASPVAAGEIHGPAPDFTLKSVQGQNIRLSEQVGQVVLVNFWASWCGPCRQEMPALEKLHNRFKALGFSVLAINLDAERDAAMGFLARTPVTFPVLLDPESETGQAWQVEAMPTTYLVDRNGQLRYKHLGYQPGDENTYENVIKQLLRE